MLRKFASTVGMLFMHHPVAPYLMVLLAVETIVVAYYGLFESDRLIFELVISGVITAAVAFPTIALVLRQHRKLEVLKSELEWLNATDQMTGLLNRQSFLRHLEDRLAALRGASGAGAFAYLDADRFKKVNDRYGHAVGDRVIRLIADAIRETVRRTDVCARLGGEEFGIFLQDASLDQAAHVAERIRAKVHEQCKALGPSFPNISVSIGVASHKPGMPLELLVQEADRSLYIAKKEGRNAVVVELRRYQAA